MADGESFELEGGERVPWIVHGLLPPATDDAQLWALLHEAAAVLRHLEQQDSTIRRRLLNVLQETAEAEEEHEETSEGFGFPPRVLEAARLAARLVLPLVTYDDIGDDDETTQQQPYRDGGFGAVPASAAAVRSLEKQTFRADDGDGGGGGVTECSICFEEFADGAQVTVMPCPSRVHKFHSDCISKWLAISNMCPLCRCELPAACYE